MREILFRGKWKDTGEWVGGFPVETVEGNFYIANTAEELGCGICIQETECYGNYEVVPETIGQYTGLTDKNGKKIFEGDILQLQGNVVEFCNGGFCVNGDVPLDAYKNAEIIGNIHDNPEKEKSKDVERWKV